MLKRLKLKLNRTKLLLKKPLRLLQLHRLLQKPLLLPSNSFTWLQKKARLMRALLCLQFDRSEQQRLERRAQH